MSFIMNTNILQVCDLTDGQEGADTDTYPEGENLLLLLFVKGWGTSPAVSAH